MWFPMRFSKATVTRPGDPPATRRPRTPKIIFFIFFAPVCEAQTGRRKHAQKRTAVLEHIKGAAGPSPPPRQRLPPRAPRQNPWTSSWAAPPTCSCSRRAARRRLCRRSRTSRSWVSTSAHISARRAVALRPSSPMRSRARARRWRLRLCRATATRWPLIPTSRRCRGWHTGGAAAHPFAHLDGAQ